MPETLQGTFSGLEGFDSALDAELSDGDSGKAFRGVGEDTEPIAGRVERAERAVTSGVGAQVDRRAVFREAGERGAPVADPGFGPAVELLGGRNTILGQRGRIEWRDRPIPAGGVLEPVPP